MQDFALKFCLMMGFAMLIACMYLARKEFVATKGEMHELQTYQKYNDQRINQLERIVVNRYFLESAKEDKQ